MASYTLQELWKKALQHDGIKDENAKFVVFSDDNPWLKKYSTAVRLFQQSIRHSRLQGR